MATASDRQPYQPGDLLGFSAHSRLGCWINLATFGLPSIGLSHVGILVDQPHAFRPLICESTTQYRDRNGDRVPCAMTGKVVDGVQFHPILPRVAGYHGKVWHYPLAEQLTSIQRADLAGFCRSLAGTGYDAFGAAGSRHTLLARLLRKPEDLVSLFCSELCAAAWRRIGILDTDNVSAWSPNRLGRYAVRHGICQRPVRVNRRKT